MNALSEDDLVRRCRDGDQTAFTELVERYRRVVFALIARSGFDVGQADDLAQEVFLRVYRGLPYFRGEARLATWIYRIAVNLCLQVRVRPRAPVVSLDAGPPATERPSLAGNRDPRFDDLELRDRLDKAIGQLPPRDRLLIAAHHLNEMRYEDLALALDVPIGTIKTQLHRARRRLREQLERQDAMPSGPRQGAGQGDRE